MEFGFRRNALIVLSIDVHNVSQMVNNQSKQTKSPKGMSYFTWHSEHPIQMEPSLLFPGRYSSHPQAISSQTHPAVTMLSQNSFIYKSSSYSEQFYRTGFEGQTLPKLYCRTQAFSRVQGALRKPARSSSSSSPYVICIQYWLAKTRRKIRSCQMQLYQKSFPEQLKSKIIGNVQKFWNIK